MWQGAQTCMNYPSQPIWRRQSILSFQKRHPVFISKSHKIDIYIYIYVLFTNRLTPSKTNAFWRNFWHMTKRINLGCGWIEIYNLTKKSPRRIEAKYPQMEATDLKKWFRELFRTLQTAHARNLRRFLKLFLILQTEKARELKTI